MMLLLLIDMMNNGHVVVKLLPSNLCSNRGWISVVMATNPPQVCHAQQDPLSHSRTGPLSFQGIA